MKHIQWDKWGVGRAHLEASQWILAKEPLAERGGAQHKSLLQAEPLLPHGPQL